MVQHWDAILAGRGVGRDVQSLQAATMVEDGTGDGGGCCRHPFGFQCAVAGSTLVLVSGSEWPRLRRQQRCARPAVRWSWQQAGLVAACAGVRLGRLAWRPPLSLSCSFVSQGRFFDGKNTAGTNRRQARAFVVWGGPYVDMKALCFFVLLCGRVQIGL